MVAIPLPFRRFFSHSLVCALLCAGTLAPAQQQQQQQNDRTTPEPSDEIVRVETELIQTDVTVFDKQGRFVDGLKPEHFALRVDGQPQNISFFERITAGSVDEEAQLAAARGGGRRPPTAATNSAGGVKPLDRGRSIFFFIDDLHLSHSSLKRTRETLSNFIDNEMTQNDETAISSASGRLGFLQQLTDEKAVLRVAVAKLSSTASRRILDGEQPRMSEYQASAVEGNNRDVLAVFTEYILRENPRMSRETAENMVRTRARNILQQSANISRGTLAALDSLVRSTSQLPGRKVVFFLSDGFFIERNVGDAFERLRQITDAAARSGVVIYTMDTQGLVTGGPDASSDVPFDPTGRLASNDLGEVSAQQAPLFTLAADTGGRALVNTNNLEKALTKAVEDSSVYYLLAWQPVSQGEGRKKSKFRKIEVSINGRPELRVQVRRGFFDAPSPVTAANNKSAKKQADEASKSVPANNPAPETKALFEALRASFPKNALPITLTLNYLNTGEAAMQLACTVQVNLPPLAPAAADGERVTDRAELVGAVYDEEGKLVVPFQRLLTPTAQTAIGDEAARSVVTTEQIAIKPGLYQVRVAARHPTSGLIGSAAQWVAIPDLIKGELSLSSVFIGGRPPAQAGDNDQPAEQMMISADRHFSRNSRLRLLVSIYNAKTSSAQPPDLALQLQIFRDDQPVITSPLRKINLAGLTDFKQIPYAAEVSLSDLPSGRYLLKLTVIDRTAKTSATQQAKFIIK